MNHKHAYLIAAHNNFTCIKTALKLIDDERNDIYLHMDLDCDKFDPREFTMIIKKSNIYIIDRMSVKWGHSSLIKVALNLLSLAVKNKYNYYHYFHGADLPIKTQDEIHDFFKKNPATEYVDYEPKNYNFAKYKTQYYHFFLGLKSYRINRILRLSNHLIAKIQELFKFQRNPNGKYYHGSAVFSITNSSAEKIIERKESILNEYRLTLACDEVFLQTEFVRLGIIPRNQIENNTSLKNLRYIDWSRRDRNSPRTFKIADLQEIVNLPENFLFARKFHEDVDKQIISALHDYLMNKSLLGRTNTKT